MWHHLLLCTLAYTGGRTLSTTCGALEDWYTDLANGSENSCCLVDGQRNHSVEVLVPYSEQALFIFQGVDRSLFPPISVDNEQSWDEANTTLLLSLPDITQFSTFTNSLITTNNVALFNYLISSTSERKIHVFAASDRDMTNPKVVAAGFDNYVNIFRI
jgi:hypothetical protein